MYSETLISMWILVFSFGVFQVSTPLKWCFLFYFSSLHYYWPQSTFISLVRNSCEMERCYKRAFQLFKVRKMKISCNIKTKGVTDFLLTVMSSSMKDYTCHYVESTLKSNVYINLNKNNVNFEIFCLNITGYLNTKKSFPICMFAVIASWKCELHTYLNFLQEF